VHRARWWSMGCAVGVTRWRRPWWRSAITIATTAAATTTTAAATATTAHRVHDARGWTIGSGAIHPARLAGVGQRRSTSALSRGSPTRAYRHTTPDSARPRLEAGEVSGVAS
jgi:hypothetical protein